MNWDESVKEYAVKLAMIYKGNPEQIQLCLKFGSVAGLLNQSYLSLVKTKELQRLEELEREEKLRLWELSGRYGEGKDERILISRGIYLLEKLTN